jgi:hydroxypyruvate isomerase
MRFEPNLSMLFTELPLLERPAAAAAAGFQAAELWWPFDEAEPSGSQVDELADAFDGAGIDLACLNLYGGDFSVGERGLTSVPGAEARFRANLGPAVELAGRLHCPTLNALYGNRDPDSTPARQEGLATENLALAAAAAETIGARLVVEALNAVEYPLYGLNTAADVIAFLDRARSSGVEARCSFDIYHVAMAGEDPMAFLARHAERIGHVQVADVPGRHEPGTGTLDLLAILEAIERAGYAGWVGFEYIPSMASEDSVRQALARLSRSQDRA